MSYPADDIRRLLSTASNAVEEAVGLLAERPALGDGGVAEAIVGAENALIPRAFRSNATTARRRSTRTTSA